MDNSSQNQDRTATLWATSAYSSRGAFALLFIGAIVLRFTFYVVYNLFFHPLAKFPGPLLARASLLWRFWFSQSGRFHRVIEQQHSRYGPVFRVSPNELSFASATSWKSIYGHPPKGKSTLIKSEFYDMYGSGYDSLCIGSERDPQNHARMKKSLSPAFSTKALMEQEEIIQRCVDGFVEKIGHESKRETGINVSDWYEMIAFDILGEMAFGETFHCVENEEPHFWIELLTKHLFFITLIDNLRRVSLLFSIGRFLLPRFTVGVRDKHSGYSRAKVDRRLQSVSPRKDILTNVVDKVKGGEVSQEELTAHASTLVIAGGETISTFLAATTFYLCKTPSAYHKLQNEIRNRYQSYQDIDAASALQLPYLQAVIQEGLRIFPPGSQGFPRTSPGVMIDNYWIPAGVSIIDPLISS
uniref:Putative cytochrome p450 n=1 Tax=Cladonia uncialis subsp. uncialis TaxID=180999 RepID=A0A1Z1CJ74_CLAUC|nr:putative cytochrome p450 [Cladonia uncialis subsp. uncialis]